MSNSVTNSNERNRESPDPASHAANIHVHEADMLVESDDDIDYEPTTEGSDENEYFEATEDDSNAYHDANDGLSVVEIDVSMDDGESNIHGGEGNSDTETTPTPHSHANLGARVAIQVSRNQILQLLGHAGLRRIVANYRGAGVRVVDMDEDDEDDLDILRRRGSKADLPPVPSEEGRALMTSGVFGSNECYKHRLRKWRPPLARRLMNRELGQDAVQSKKVNGLISQGLIPSSNADTIIHYDSKCYSGQFSDDGNIFFSCAKDFKVRMYDTSNPYEWKYYKTVFNNSYVKWTITDATLSPDNRYLAFSSLQTTVCLASTDPGETSEPHYLDLSVVGGRHGRRAYNSSFGIWSIRFSGDGREIVAGTSDHSVYVYDIETRQSILRIPGHTEDVNAVCFGDTSSPHILYSGSDDTLIKVWDRRSMGDSREAGVFMGHTEGLTYVDSKGDGRYVLSNGKDQTMKLWDLRKMMPTEKASKLDPSKYTTGFDYRFTPFPDDDYTPHPHDCSLVTFRGHRVLKTLIRCHFSPPGSTNSRYVYSGSEDGSVYIYNLDATLVGKVDVNKATKNSRPRDPDMFASYEMVYGRSSETWMTCVRDASWHPNAPIIAATSWNGWAGTTGTCTIHSWNDGADGDEAEPQMGRRVNERLQDDERFYNESVRETRTGSGRRTGLRSQRVAANNDEDREDWW